MNNFIPPVKGTKLGELNHAWFRRYYYYFSDASFQLSKIFFIFGIFVALPIGIGVEFIRDPFNPVWISWLFAFIVCLFGVICACLIIYGLFTDNSGGTVEIYDNKIGLFLVNKGVELNDYFIPFKDKNSNVFHGVKSFKLDGDYLMIRTAIHDDFVAYYGLNENQMKFKIESKYAFCKDELLSYLNNLIPEN